MLVWMGLWDSSWPVMIVVCMIMILVAIALNHRHAKYSDAVTRQQGRLVVSTMAAAGTLAFVLVMIPKILLGHMIVDRNILPVFPLMFLSALALAILRYRLFDIEIIINRTVVYGALTGLIVTIYALVVSAFGILFAAKGSPFIALLATGLIAVIFQPLRDRVQRSVNRLMYGERDDPYAVLSRFGERLEATLAPEAVLPTIVETVAHALKLSYTAIALRRGEDFAVVTAYGLPRGELLHLPLVYQGETIGQLILGPRSPNETFTPGDRRLLDDLAHQAGIAVHAVRLTADLQRSRERLVTAREEERRRLRRDLHDGLGPVLAAMSFRLDAVNNLMENDPDAARQLVLALKSQIQTSLDDIRQIAYDLRPPALDELGLVGALKEHVIAYSQSNNLQIAFDAPMDSLHLPAAVEVAVYRIALEAMTNVVRHAHANHCRISLSVDEVLCLEISDDGGGVPINGRIGVGVTSMRERAEELGGTFVMAPIPAGGMGVVVRLPLPVDDRNN